MSAETKPIDAKDFGLAIKDLSDEVLLSLKSQLSNSLSRLKETNDELSEEIKGIEGKIQELKEGEKASQELNEDIELYTTTIKENLTSIKNQSERSDILKSELIRRGLEATTTINKEQEGIYL